MTQKMIPGERGWMDIFNTAASAYDNNRSDWTSTGITFLNGFSTTNTDEKISYSVIRLGNTRFLQIRGRLNYPAQSSGESAVAFKLPDNLATEMAGSFGMDVENMVFMYGDQALNLSIVDGNSINVMNYSIRGDGSLLAGSKYIRFMCSF